MHILSKTRSKSGNWSVTYIGKDGRIKRGTRHDLGARKAAYHAEKEKSLSPWR